ncbi:hypothetical protein TPHA_0O01810 [Tetrapisispora phaffii CBS 4417]|uniref:Uncharacterized protein n=1 Tax=Tetrapisispora phaffii (strain ATCC 24235 / CBS 4417 / NBRC 1672 / NRRL Y-8282 / UCD 70-5) TaxID=1071381 RepID=G8C1X0_TETPH|nr:hypothetical protein TPHA_0O01810 [Tetrapisispora phaffii CBS 4417]CCE66148.1 hypothetical protein TPHA_0O01810 [Tetrapisispora phaffii CBS 4417]
MAIKQNKFPTIDQVNIRTFKGKSSNIVDSLRSLGNNAALFISIAYLTLEYIIRPLLNEQFRQRIQLSGTTLITLRKLVADLKGKLDEYRLISAIGFNETNKTVDRCTQTSKDFISRGAYSVPTVEQINIKLEDFTLTLDMENGSDGIQLRSNEETLQEIKESWKDIDDVLESEKKLTSKTKVLECIRDIKGWYVNGRIP